MTGAIARLRPAAVLGLGQAGGRPVITLERIAINLLDGPHSDNAGRRRTDHPVVRDGPDAYFARLLFARLSKRSSAGGLPPRCRSARERSCAMP